MTDFFFDRKSRFFLFIPSRYHIVHFVIAGLTRNLQQINGIAGQARNDVRGYFDSGLVSLTTSHNRQNLNQDYQDYQDFWMNGIFASLHFGILVHLYFGTFVSLYLCTFTFWYLCIFAFWYLCTFASLDKNIFAFLYAN